jgi:SepF-like predicted cell division protein (DUF552 family)
MIKAGRCVIADIGFLRSMDILLCSVMLKIHDEAGRFLNLEIRYRSAALLLAG